MPYAHSIASTAQRRREREAAGRMRKYRLGRARVIGYNKGRAIQQQPKAELKCSDVTVSTLGFINPPTGTSFSNSVNASVIQGTEVYNRIGRKIYMKSIQIKGYVVSAATGVADIGRIFLIYDSQPNGTVPLIGDVFNNCNAAATTNGLSMVNINNRARFTILRDQEVYLPAVTNTAGVLTNGPSFPETAQKQYEIDWFVPLKGRETIYNGGNTGSGADIVSGSLFVGVTSLVSVVASWNFVFTQRLRFYD